MMMLGGEGKGAVVAVAFIGQLGMGITPLHGGIGHRVVG